MGCFSSKNSHLSEDDQYINRRKDHFSASVPLESYKRANTAYSYPARAAENRHKIIHVYRIYDDSVIGQTRTSLNPHLPQQKIASGEAALFGEYRCICGRTWSSRLSWQGNYQKCKRCQRSVFPHKQRQLRSSDMSADKENIPHPEELCQKCKSLGSYCGRQKRNNMQPRRRHASLSLY